MFSPHLRIPIPLPPFLCLLAFAFLTSAAEPEAQLPKKHVALLENYCFDCHDADTQKGKVNLESLPFQITTPRQAELWQKVLNAMNSGEMPPEDKRQPQNAEKADFLDALAQTMVLARRKLSDAGGKITMRRLNRREYRNTIKHLTGVSPDVSTLPSDAGAGTFDTVGASQFISSDQFEQYLKLGRSAIDEVFERRAGQQRPSQVFRVEPETTVNVQSLEKLARLEETNERYLLWKAEVDKAALAPENRQVMDELRKKFPGLDDKWRLRLYQNADLLKPGPDAQKFGFGDSNAASFSNQGGYKRSHAYIKHYAELPHSDRGTYLKLAWDIQRIDLTPKPKDLPPGTYKLRIRAGTVEGSPASRHFIEVGHPQRVNQVPAGFASLPLSSHQVTGTVEAPEIIETTVEIGVDTPRELAIQERRPSNGKSVRDAFFRYKRENGYGTPPAIWIDWIELEGPIQEVIKSKIVRVEPERTINPANEKEIANIEDEYARFTRWQKGVDEAAKTPVNQVKIAEIRKADRLIDHPVRFYAYADRLEGTPDPNDFGFRDSQKAAAGHPEGDRRNLAYHKNYAALPHRDRGAYLKLAHGTGRVIVAPKDLPPGNYVMRVHVGAVKGTPSSRRFIQVGHPQRQIPSRNWGLEGPAISSHQVTGTIENPETIEIPLEIGSQTTREFAVQEKQPNTGNLKELWGAHNEWKTKNGYGHPPAIWIDWVELEGPIKNDEVIWKQRREVEHHANAKVGGTYNGYFKGGYERAQAFLKTGQPQKGIADKQEAHFHIRAFEQNGPTYRRYLGDPLTQTGSFLTISSANRSEFIALPPEHPSGWHKTKHIVDSLPPGDYRLRFRIGAIQGAPTERRFVDLGSVPAKDQFNHLTTYQVTGTTEAPQIIEARVQLTTDGPRKFELREKRDPKNDQKRYQAARKETGLGPVPALWIDWVEWEGPLPQTSEAGLANILASHHANNGPSEGLRARNILTDFALTAFRQAQPDPKFIDQLVALFKTRRSAGDTFDVAIRTPLAVIL
ncbi:MAG: hypothetical protein ACJASX_004590, partial [Limisphaerales bacterium]